MAQDRTIPSDGSKSVVSFTIKVGTGGKLEALPTTYDVMSVTVGREVNRIPWAKLELRDGNASAQDFPISNEAALVPGQEIEIDAGYSQQNATIFRGIIIKHGIKAIGASSRLMIECRDMAVKMTIGRKNAYHLDKTDNEVLSDMIAAYPDLTKEIADTDTTHKSLVQYYTSDWDFLVCRAEANGQLVFVDDGKITTKAPDDSGEAELNLQFGATIVELEAEMDARTQFSAIQTAAWSPTDQEIITADSSEEKLKAQGNFSSSDLAEVIGLETLELKHPGWRSDTELQSWVKGRSMRSSLSRIRGRVKFDGYPTLKPGMYVNLYGVGERFNGDAYVTGVRHTIIGGKWQTDAQFGLSDTSFAAHHNLSEVPGNGLLPAVSGLQIGIVRQVQEDPDGEDRVLVRLPMVNNEEDGIWARLAVLDGGKYRGTFFRPEENDEVVVGFFNDDPRDPVVLGMLNSSSLPAPVEAAKDNDEKGIYSRSGMRIAFNDKDRSITIQTLNKDEGGDLEAVRKSGTKLDKNQSIILDDSAETILLQDKHGNKIEMSKDGITISSAKNVVIEGKEIKVDAQSKLAATSGSASEFKSDGNTTVKGAMVNIN